MTMLVPIDLGWRFTVRAGPGEVFDLLADAPACARSFPGLERFADLGDGVYRWELREIGDAQVRVKPAWASRQGGDRAAGTVTWTPVEGIGNTRMGGGWQIHDLHGKATRCDLRFDGAIEVPLPQLALVVVEPVVVAAFGQLVEQYAAALAQRLGGEIA